MTPSFSPLRGRLAPLLTGVLAFVLVATAVLYHATQEQARYETATRAALVGEAGGLRAELERAVDSRTSLIDALSGYAIAEVEDGRLDEEGFERFASRLVEGAGIPIRSVQLAPEAVVTYVHPVEGNEAAIGHDLLADEQRRDAVLETIEARATVVAGPLELLQGGTAIILRSPVFLQEGDEERWWGLATVVADFAPLVEEAGLTSISSDRDVAVRFLEGRRNTFGSSVYGDQEIFDGDPVVFDVALPSGRWQLGLLPEGGWDEVVWPRRTSTLVIGLLLALAVAGLVTRMMSSRQRYQRASDDLAQLIETASVPIVQVDRAGLVVGWNRAAEELSGLESHDVRDRPVGELGNGADRLGEVVTETLRSGAARSGVELVLESPTGPRTLIVNVSPRSDGTGRVLGAVAVAQDISDRLEAEEVRTENEAIARTARLKDEFLAGMSHELRTPLNGIIGLSSILSKRTFGELNDKQAGYVEQIQKSGRHLLELINDVLDLARIEAGREELQLRPLDPRNVAEEALAVVRELAAAKGQQVVVDVGRSLPPVEADARRVHQVLVNLLSNAVKFTPDGGTIGLTVRADDELRFTVWDTGIGIPTAKQGLLFQAFQQIDASLSRTYGGTGLGLSLTRRLVELHGGRIAVESEENEGARFTVFLPLAEVPKRRAEPQDAPIDIPAGPRVRVLVADDHEVNRSMIADYLQANGIDVVHASDGVEAVDRARQVRPDLILMDVQMPHRDGLEATRILKADAATCDIPVVALTALAMVGDDDRCLAAGCDAYVAKPVDPAEVLLLIRELTSATAVDA